MVVIATVKYHNKSTMIKSCTPRVFWAFPLSWKVECFNCSTIKSPRRSAQISHAPTVSEKNSWDTSTQPPCFFLLLARLIVLPMLFIAVNSPNLAQQHWEGKETAKSLNRSQQFRMRLHVGRTMYYPNFSLCGRLRETILLLNNLALDNPQIFVYSTRVFSRRIVSLSLPKRKIGTIHCSSYSLSRNCEGCPILSEYSNKCMHCIVLYCLHITIVYKSITIKNEAKH